MSFSWTGLSAMFSIDRAESRHRRRLPIGGKIGRQHHAVATTASRSSCQSIGPSIKINGASADTTPANWAARSMML